MGVLEADGSRRWGEERAGTIPATGQDLRVRGWMGWEEVDEPYCELRGSLTPLKPQVMGFYRLFNQPRPGIFCFLGNFT